MFTGLDPDVLEGRAPGEGVQADAMTRTPEPGGNRGPLPGVPSRMRSTLVVAALCGVLTVAACGHGPVVETPAPPAGWRQAPQPPLSPRADALGLWTGREALLVGGTDEPPCPPAASCRKSVESALQCRTVVGHAVSDGAEATEVINIRKYRGRCRPRRKQD